MTRSLLGSTALLCLLFVNEANAAECKPAPILSTPQLKISGQTSFNSWFFNNKERLKLNEVDLSNSTNGTFQATPNHRQYYGHDQLFSVDRSKLRFNVDGKTDRGMEYGLVVVIEGNTSATKSVRENYLYFGGSWGKIYAGDTYGVEDTMAFGGFSQWGGTGFIDGPYERVVNKTFGAPNSIDLAGNTSRDTKFTYLTPRWNGLQAGVSFSPMEHRGEQIISSKTSTSSPKAPFYKDNVAGGINFIHKFCNGLDMALSATGVVARSAPPYAGAASRHMVSGYAFGGNFNYANIGFGLEYGNNGKSYQYKRTGTPVNAGQFLDFGLSYTYGPTKFSAGYFYGWRNALGAVNPAALEGRSNINIAAAGYRKEKAKTNAVSAAIDRKLAPGLGVYVEYQYYNMKNPAAGDEARRLNAELANGGAGAGNSPTPNNKANVVVVGSRLVF